MERLVEVWDIRVLQIMRLNPFDLGGVSQPFKSLAPLAVAYQIVPVGLQVKAKSHGIVSVESAKTSRLLLEGQEFRPVVLLDLVAEVVASIVERPGLATDPTASPK